MKTIQRVCLVVVLLLTARFGHAEVVDKGTQRNGMHSCEKGMFVTGVQASKNLLLCEKGSGDWEKEFVEKEMQRQGMLACPLGHAMTGFHEKKNLIACVPVLGPQIPSAPDVKHRRMEMHACPPGQPLSGIDVKRNAFICGTAEEDVSVAELLDSGTSRSGMHVCTPGRVISGVHIKRNLFLCLNADADYGNEIVDVDTRSHGMHACPEHWAMTGLHADDNRLACVKLAASQPRVVDKSFQREGMHACPPGQAVSGIHAKKNLLLCKTQYVLLVNSFAASSTLVKSGDVVEINWNVTCSDPGCLVRLLTNNVPEVVANIGTKTVKITKDVKFDIVGTAGGGVDSKSFWVYVKKEPPAPQACLWFRYERPGECFTQQVCAADVETVRKNAWRQCENCTFTEIPAGESDTACRRR